MVNMIALEQGYRALSLHEVMTYLCKLSLHAEYVRYSGIVYRPLLGSCVMPVHCILSPMSPMLLPVPRSRVG